MTVNDNPFDPSEDRLTLQVDDVTIPLESSGTKIQFFSRTPTQTELDRCRHLHLTNETEWNPRDVMFRPDVPFVSRTSSLHFDFVQEPGLFDVSPALVALKERALASVSVTSDEEIRVSSTDA